MKKIRTPYLLLLPGFAFLLTFFIFPILSLAQVSTATPIKGGDIGEFEQTFRFRASENFESGANRILVATDILSRGIDVSDISHVINFDVPDIEENYIHRIGRTGRATKKGIAITFNTE